MEKIISLFITILCLSNQTNAQCFILKVNMGDCALHTTGISNFNPIKTGLPAFVLYPTSSREDSTDIEFAGKFSVRGIKLLFNDKWNEKLNCENSMSCVFGLNREGKTVYTSSLDATDSAQLNTFLLNNAPEKSVHTVQNDSFLYTSNNLGTIKILNAEDKQLVKILRFADFDLQLLANKMPKAEKQRFEKYGNIINKRTSTFLGKFQNFRFDNKGDLFVKVLFHNTLDSLTTHITDEHAIVHYDARGNYKDVYMIKYSESLYFHDHDFLLVNEDPLFGVTYNREKHVNHMQPTAEINFIGRYVKKKGNYQFSGFLPYKMPYIYQLKFGYSYLGSGTSTYPFFVPKFSNEVYNLKTNQSVFIIDSAKYIAGIDTSFFDTEKSGGETHEKLNVRGIRPVFGQTDLYAMPYLYDGSLYLNYYTTNLTKKHTYYWGKATVGGKAIVSASVKDGQDLFAVIYAEKDKTWKSILIPMSLFYPEKGN